MLKVLNLFLCVSFSIYYVDSKYLTLPEGSPCTWNGVAGTCVHVYRCLSAVWDPLRKMEDVPICEFQGTDPVICCTDCDLVDDTRLMIWNNHTGFFYKNGGKAHDKCIDYMNQLDYQCTNDGTAEFGWWLDNKTNCYMISLGLSRVKPSGGKPVQRNEYPHMALLGFGSDVSSLQWLCSGSLISHNFILTAAHCISKPNLGPVTYVALGILKRSDPPALWRQYKVKNIIPHPEYKAPSKYHDIALLETDSSISFETLYTENTITEVLPACLHVEDDLTKWATATGWGAIGYRKGLSDILLSVSLEKYKDEECAKKYPPHRHLLNGVNSTTQVCYGDREGIQDTCEGDSGGPLQSSRNSFLDCVYNILGVTSYGTACEIVDNAGIYTKVQPYVPWIESVVWP